MEKIEFKNGESPYLSAENLNKIQDNVENAIKSAETNSNEGISSLQESIDVELTKKLNKTDKATPAETIQGTDNNKYTTPLAIKSAIEKALEGYEPGGAGGGDTFPIGGTIEWHFDTLPPGGDWVWPDTEYPEEEYPKLSERCGGRFNLPTTPAGYFRTPKKAGLVAVGKDPDDPDFDKLGKIVGEKDHRHDFTIGQLFSYGAPVGDDYTNAGAYKDSKKFFAGNTGTIPTQNVNKNSALQNAMSNTQAAR